jgi:hypothetical protein
MQPLSRSLKRWLVRSAPLSFLLVVGSFANAADVPLGDELLDKLLESRDECERVAEILSDPNWSDGTSEDFAPFAEELIADMWESQSLYQRAGWPKEMRTDRVTVQRSLQRERCLFHSSGTSQG